MRGEVGPWEKQEVGLHVYMLSPRRRVGKKGSRRSGARGGRALQGKRPLMNLKVWKESH